MRVVCHMGEPTTPTAKGAKHRARSTQHPELDARREALRAESHSPAWKHLPAQVRFHRSYAVIPGALPESDCHHWIGVMSDEGYGRFTTKGYRGALAHRYAIEVIAGFGPLGRRRVYRSCGNTSCVNPAHLTFAAGPLVWNDPITAPMLDGVVIPRPTAARFWSKVDKESARYCWRWTGTIGSEGYGQITLSQDKVESTHRMAYALANGSIPKGLQVCHGPECEDHTGAGRLCVNPAHLVAATSASNMEDRKGGHFRRPWAGTPLSPEIRAAGAAFFSTAIGILKEQGDLDEGASVEEMLALDLATERAA